MAKPRGLTLREILATTPASRKELSNNVALRSVKTGTSRRSGLEKIMAQAVSIDRSQDLRTKYTTSIEVFPMNKGEAHSYVRLSCSCDDFMYTFEYALAQKGAAEIVYGNGEPPTDRNPRKIPGMCKHLCALSKEAKKVGFVK